MMNRDFAIVKGRVVITFGKYKGEYLEDVAVEDRNYLEWLLTQDISEEFREEIEKVI